MHSVVCDYRKCPRHACVNVAGEENPSIFIVPTSINSRSSVKDFNAVQVPSWLFLVIVEGFTEGMTSFVAIEARESINHVTKGHAAMAVSWYVKVGTPRPSVFRHVVNLCAYLRHRGFSNFIIRLLLLSFSLWRNQVFVI